MSASPALPQKQELPSEIWKVATTLSDEAQDAAFRKARELGFDLNKGRISLEETFINLSHARNIIVDAVEKKKIVQLPLKLQYTLLLETQKSSDALKALMTGTDAVLSLEDTVDDLTSTIWQYNLHNMSEEILGFHTKMNQLKEQETLIRSATREANDFQASSSRANELLKQIEDFDKTGAEHAKSILSSVDQASSALAKAQEHEQKSSALAIQSQQHDAAAAQYAANAKNAAAEIEAAATKARGLQSEMETAKGELAELNGKVAAVLATTEKTTNESVTEFQRRYEQTKAATESETTNLRDKLNGLVQQLNTDTQAKADAALAGVEKRSTEMEMSVGKLVADTGARLTQSETSQEQRLASQLSDFTKKTEAAAEEIRAEHKARLAEITDKSDKSIAAGDAEFKRLTAQLDELEGRIRDSIERATGFTLFHSFQKRQIDLARSKKFWAIALACAVGISLIASGVFIYSLRYVQVYNAAFYLKLSISLPLIYAIAFCNIQYSRERRLEEEYAFKSNISISLDPYRKLVAELIDQGKPDEVAKYTAFIIESVTRVFTSPTERVFEDDLGDKNSAEKIVKAVGDLIEPLARVIKK
jgi:hypothetical protein